MNAIGIEVGLLILKYGLKTYPLFPDWTMPFKALCGEKRECGNFMWWFVIFNLIVLPPLIQLSTFALYDHTLELLDASQPFSAGAQITNWRFYFMIWTNIPAFNQLYEWMHCKETVKCVSWAFIRKSYWIIMIWSILLIEYLLIFMYYPK